MSPRIASSTRVVRGTAGFTLVEVLVTVTIIGILASVTLAAIAGARQTARIAATKATITKLNDLVLRQYDSYLTRRVTMSFSPTSTDPQAVMQIRLRVLRELMRMEMPDRYTDITNPGSIDIAQDPPKAADENSALSFKIQVQLASGPVTFSGRVYRSSLARAYFRRFLAKTLKAGDTYESPELLYLIVSHMGKDALGQFSDSEIGDVDGDGWPEFLDAWGNPIYFLRWAPGFNDSQVQANVVPPRLNGPGVDPTDLWDSNADVQTEKAKAAASEHDPFDPRGVDPGAWRLVPLIVSAGPDGIYDISFSARNKPDPIIPNPVAGYYFNGDPYARFIGLPADIDNTSVTATGPKNGTLNHYDNIHNHRLQD